jgi:integrase
MPAVQVSPRSTCPHRLPPGARCFVPSIDGGTTGGGHLSCHAAHHRWTGYCEQAGVEIDIHQLRHARATRLINNGAAIEAAAVLGLTPASSA